MSLQRGINFRSLAEKMGNCSGAEVRGICTEAGMYALRERRQYVGQEDFEMSIAKVSSRLTTRNVEQLNGRTLMWGCCWGIVGVEEERGGGRFGEQIVQVDVAVAEQSLFYAYL